VLDEASIQDAARRLDESEKSRKQIRQLSLEHPGITIDDAYAVQKAWVDLKVNAGRTI
jgi:2-oxo-hept-3-ene-1,7-dioate hydratase